MAILTISVEPDDLLGLNAVAALSPPADGTEAGAAGTARVLLQERLAARLDELGLPWAPSPEAVRSRADEDAEASEAAPPGALRRFISDERVRKYGTGLLAVAVLVVLWGGYVKGWQWTGFPANAQLWDWLHLLLLPVAFGTLPIWIQHAGYMSRARRASYGIAVAGFAAFVLAGYLLPIRWTGFPGNTLWSWFELIVLPAALISMRAWPAAGRAVRAHHKAAFAALTLAWIVTLIGGYAWRWTWTGYQGNTLWDWLQLLLLPLVFPTILLPALLKWISGNAAERARREAEAAMERSGRSPAVSQPKA